MLMIIKLAWRNIWRNWRRTLITITAIVFAIVLSVIFRGMQEGTYEANIKNAVEMYTGYIQIQDKDYLEKPTLLNSFKPDDKLIKLIESNKKIKAYTERIYGNGLIGYKENSMGAGLFGIDPVKEREVSNLFDRVKKGRFLDPEDKDGIVLGQSLMKNLKADVGDTIVVLSSGLYGSMGNMKLEIVGAFKTGTPDLDRSAAFINLSTADRLLSMNGRVNAIPLNLSSLHDLGDVQQYLKKNIDNKDLAVLDWEELMPELVQGIELDNVSGIIYLGILIVVVAFGILNTVIMSIQERSKEFGIMLAVGIKNSKLIMIVFFEMLFLTVTGLIVGNIIAWIANYIFYLNPITLSGDMVQMYEEFGFIPQILTTMDPWIFLKTTISIFGIFLISFLYPVIRLSKIEAIKGIRYT